MAHDDATATSDAALPGASMPESNTGDGQVSPLDAPGLFGAMVELVGGEERLTLSGALVLWQREQDRLLNRAWRRPGGLRRPGGA